MNTIELPNTATLTPTEEVELARRIEAGTFAGYLLDAGCPTWATADELAAVRNDGHAAWQQFYLANTRLAALVAHRWARRFNVDVDDIIQECCVALAPAIRAWDWRRGTRFSTLAWMHLTRAAQSACLVACDAHHSTPTDQAAEPPSVDPRDVIWASLRTLDATGRKVIEDRFGFTTGSPVSYLQIANQMNTSKHFVRQVEIRALQQLESRVLPAAA